MRGIEAILERIEPPSARGRVMRYLKDRFGDEVVQEGIMADPRQATLEGIG